MANVADYLEDFTNELQHLLSNGIRHKNVIDCSVCNILITYLS